MKNENRKNPFFVSFWSDIKQNGPPFFVFVFILLKQKSKNSLFFVAVFASLGTLRSFIKFEDIEKPKTKKVVFRFVLEWYKTNRPFVFRFYLYLVKSKVEKSFVFRFTFCRVGYSLVHSYIHLVKIQKPFFWLLKDQTKSFISLEQLYELGRME